MGRIVVGMDHGDLRADLSGDLRADLSGDLRADFRADFRRTLAVKRSTTNDLW